MKIIIEMFSELYEHNILKDFGMWSKDTNRPIVLFYKRVIFLLIGQTTSFLSHLETNLY